MTDYRTAKDLPASPDLDDLGVNASGEAKFSAVLGARLARRGVLRGMVGAVATVGLGGTLAATAGRRDALAAGVSSLTFTEISHGPQKTHAVAPGYDAKVLIRWGDKVLADASAFDIAGQTGAAQAGQFGYNNDFQAFLPLPLGGQGSNRGLLWVNHEYAEAHMMFPGLGSKGTAENVTQLHAEVEMQAVGGSVVELARGADGWKVVLGPLNRRITATTRIRLAGPAAGSARMRTGADLAGDTVIGTFGNCAGGVTPWGTILTCEENFDMYFAGDASKGPEAAGYKRTGLTGKPRYGWARFDSRFNVNTEPNEPNRFGWVVEVDPYDPQSIPVKRTALGRFKHEGANTALTPDGRVVVYSGDDQRFEYLYRFVSRDRFNPADRGANRDLLDHGTLSVARFDDTGGVSWLPLVFGEGPITMANGFSSQADVVIDARRAADLVKATPMDRPEEVETNPATGRVYVVLTNNSSRKAEQLDGVNPRAGNLYGQIVEMIAPSRDGKPDHGADSFTWDMFLLAGNPAMPGHKAKYGDELSASGWLACPDNIAFDNLGRMWIATDQGEEQHKYAIGDGIWACDTSGPGRAVTRMFYRVPTGAEMCGPEFTPDNKTFFVAVQHPASDDEGSSFDAPSTRWPDFVDTMPPRPSVVVITKADGGLIGS